MGRTPWFAAALVGATLVVAGCGEGSSGPTAPVRLVGADGTSVPTSAAPSRAAPAARSTSGTTSGTTSVQASAPDVVVRTERVTKPVTYRTVTKRDPDLDKGETRVVREGVPGILELTFRVTYTDGVRTARVLASKRTVQAPVNRVVAVGTRVTAAPGDACDPNYTGACVPIDTDVDCAGGSGNGPSYVQGPVRVVGTDIYGLDRDGDGIGCE